MINVYGSKTTDLSTFMRSQDTFAYVKDQSLVPQNHGCGERKIIIKVGCVCLVFTLFHKENVKINLCSFV